MFPLGSPLLPGAVLPLHVFELRYRMMMDDVVHTDPAEFGVVLIERGHEVGGGDVRSIVGTVAHVARHDELEDGRRAVIAVGVRRIRIEQWLPDDPYPVALVSDWPDDPVEGGVGDERVATERLRGAVDRFLAVVRRLDEHTPEVDPRSDVESLDDYSYRVAITLPLGAADRQRVLESSDAIERSSRVTTAVEDLEALVRFRLGLGDSPG